MQLDPRPSAMDRRRHACAFASVIYVGPCDACPSSDRCAFHACALDELDAVRVERDRYREALEEIVAKRHDRPAQGPLADIAQRALDA